MTNALNINPDVPFLTTTDPRVRVGRFTYGNPKFMMWGANERIEIGAFCSIAEDVTIFGGGEHNSQWVTTYPLRIAFNDPLASKDGHPASKGTTHIGNDVWIGYRATVLSGVHIGDGAIIGAGSVVTKDVAPYSIHAGSPSRWIKNRFDTESIHALLEIRWWDWPLEKIQAHIPLLCDSDIRGFIAEATKPIGKWQDLKQRLKRSLGTR